MTKKCLTSIVILSVWILSCYGREESSETKDAGVSESDASGSAQPDAQSFIEQSSTDSGARPDQITVQVLVVCGDGIIAGPEQCDGEKLGSETCESLGYFAGGELTCDRSTCTFDTSDCRTAPAECGNGIVEADEQCEVELFEGMKCIALERGYTDGDVTCDSETCTFDLSNCGIESECGNGILEGTEQCDGSDLNDMTCVDLNYGFASGTLRCDSDTCTFDISDCEFSESCGNGTVEPGEQCDGSNLSSSTCTSLGYRYGTLACSSDCRYDSSECSNDMTNVVCTRGGCFPVIPPST